MDELWRRSDKTLRTLVPWDMSAWGQVDPATLLSTGCLVLGVPFDSARESAVFALEHDEGEVNRLIDLVHRTPPAGGLHVDTEGRPQLTARFGRLLEPLGVRDDLRVALMRDGFCWASLYAYRRNAEFSAEEVAILGALSGDLADGVRLSLLRADASAGAGHERGAPGLILVAPDGSLNAMSEVAADLFRKLGMNLDYVATDWGSALRRQANRDAPERGGYNAFCTYTAGVNQFNPAAHNFIRGSGLTATFGWSTSPQLEEMRNRWLQSSDDEARRRLGREMQRQAFIDVPYVPLGQFYQPTAYREDVTGMLKGLALFWNIRRG